MSALAPLLAVLALSQVGPTQSARGPDASKSRFIDMRKAFQEADVPIQMPPLASWQERSRCGLNCVYMLLNSAGRNVKYEELESAVGEVPIEGLSLEQMRELCQRFGLVCDVIYGDLSNIDRIVPPAIIHLGEKAATNKNHYMFYSLCEPAGPEYWISDGTTGVGQRMSRDALNGLSRIASGYVLVIRKPVYRSVLRGLTSAVWAMSLSVWAWVLVSYLRSIVILPGGSRLSAKPGHGK